MWKRLQILREVVFGGQNGTVDKQRDDRDFPFECGRQFDAHMIPWMFQPAAALFVLCVQPFGSDNGEYDGASGNLFIDLLGKIDAWLHGIDVNEHFVLREGPRKAVTQTAGNAG